MRFIRPTDHHIPSRMSASSLGTPPPMPTIRPNRVDVNADFICTATTAAEFVPVALQADKRSQRYVRRLVRTCRCSCRGRRFGAFRALRRASPALPPARPGVRTPILPCNLRGAVGATFTVAAREKVVSKARSWGEWRSALAATFAAAQPRGLRRRRPPAGSYGLRCSRLSGAQPQALEGQIFANGPVHWRSCQPGKG